MLLPDNMLNEVGYAILKKFQKKALTDVVMNEMVEEAKKQILASATSAPVDAVEESVKKWFKDNIVKTMI